MQQWEYLVVEVVGMGEGKPKDPIHFIVVAINGREVAEFENKYGYRLPKAGESRQSFVARAGLDGWELVSADHQTLYFKRPKP